MLKAWADKRAQPWTVGDHDVVFPALAHTRRLCARLINADDSEIALVPNTSFGLSLAARALPLGPGDVVLVSDREFPSLIYAWRAIEKQRGIRLELLPTLDGLLDEEALLQALEAGAFWGRRIGAVVVSWVSFATGYRVDLERLGATCKARGIFLVVDAMQGIGPCILDARACHADIIACGGYKWLLAPWGAAFVYVRRELIEKLDPPIVGWFVDLHSEDYTNLLDYDLTYYKDARRFEVMTIGAQDFVALGRSLELYFEIGPSNVQAHVQQLTSRLVDWTLSGSDMRLVTPADRHKRAGIVSIARSDAQATSLRLKAHGVMHSLREGAIRLSPYFYNTEQEVHSALRILSG